MQKTLNWWIFFLYVKGKQEFTVLFFKICMLEWGEKDNGKQSIANKYVWLLQTRNLQEFQSHRPVSSEMETVFLIPFLKQFVLLLLKYFTSFIKHKIYKETKTSQHIN